MPRLTAHCVMLRVIWALVKWSHSLWSYRHEESVRHWGVCFLWRRCYLNASELCERVATCPGWLCVQGYELATLGSSILTEIRQGCAKALCSVRPDTETGCSCSPVASDATFLLVAAADKLNDGIKTSRGFQRLSP